MSKVEVTWGRPAQTGAHRRSHIFSPTRAPEKLANIFHSTHACLKKIQTLASGACVCGKVLTSSRHTPFTCVRTSNAKKVTLEPHRKDSVPGLVSEIPSEMALTLSTSGYQCWFLAADGPWCWPSWCFKRRLHVQTHMRVHSSARVCAVCFFRKNGNNSAEV